MRGTGDKPSPTRRQGSRRCSQIKRERLWIVWSPHVEVGRSGRPKVRQPIRSGPFPYTGRFDRVERISPRGEKDSGVPDPSAIRQYRSDPRYWVVTFCGCGQRSDTIDKCSASGSGVVATRPDSIRHRTWTWSRSGHKRRVTAGYSASLCDREDSRLRWSSDPTASLPCGSAESR